MNAQTSTHTFPRFVPLGDGCLVPGVRGDSYWSGDDGCSSLISQSGGLITPLLLLFKQGKRGGGGEGGGGTKLIPSHKHHISVRPPQSFSTCSPIVWTIWSLPLLVFNVIDSWHGTYDECLVYIWTTSNTASACLHCFNISPEPSFPQGYGASQWEKVAGLGGSGACRQGEKFCLQKPNFCGLQHILMPLFHHLHLSKWLHIYKIWP